MDKINQNLSNKQLNNAEKQVISSPKEGSPLGILGKLKSIAPSLDFINLVETIGFEASQNYISSIVNGKVKCDEMIVNSYQSTLEQDKIRAKGLPKFPTKVLPHPIQQLLKACNKTLNFHPDFLATSILCAVSVAIGKTHMVQVKKGWVERPTIWLAIVGKAGTSKSHPLDFALSPIMKKDVKIVEEHKKELEEYKTLKTFTTKELEAVNVTKSELKEPVLAKYMCSDTTFETLATLLNNNKRGIIIYRDEIYAFFKDLNKYRKGSDQEQFLQIWSGKSVIIDRADRNIYIPNPLISLVGTIQTNLLKGLTKDSRSENGFMHRMLFVAPNNLKPEKWNIEDIQQHHIDNYHTIINKLLNIPYDSDSESEHSSTTLKFTPDAKKHLYAWQAENTKKCRLAEDDNEIGIYRKLEVYISRIALILHLLKYAAGEGGKGDIELETVKNAIEVIEYFRQHSLKVSHLINESTPLDLLSKKQVELYEKLPDTFTKAKGKEMATKMKFSDRTFSRFLNNATLFERIKQGSYLKKY